MGVTVRRAVEADFGTFVTLIRGLAEYEQLPPPDAEAEGRLHRHGWPSDGTPPLFSAWIAELQEDEGEPVAAGYAITFQTYSSFLARPTLYIEDIFVLPQWRRAGVGTALFAHLVATARSLDCGRVEWVVLDWNTGAQEFYRKHGGRHLIEWQSYRLRLDEAGE
jgi:GNAT superfamily N-acetyltransferase